MAAAPPLEIVFVGGSWGSLSTICAMHKADLQARCNITLVAENDYIESNFGAPKFLVTSATDGGAFYDKAHVSFTELFADGSTTFNRQFKVAFVHGKVTNVSSAEITTNNGKSVKYDVLVLATGIKYAAVRPVDAPTKEARIAQVKAQADRYAAANSILVAGGGAVGVELIGELEEMYRGQGKQLHLVSSSSALLPRAPPWAQADVLKSLTSRGVHVHLNEKLEDPESSGPNVRMKSGKVIEADVLTKCWAESPNTEFLSASGLASSLTDKGFIKVDPTMRISDCAYNAYALGDAANFPVKSSPAMEGQVKAIVANIKARINGEEPKATFDGKSFGPAPGGDILVSAGTNTYGQFTCATGCTKTCLGCCCCCCLGFSPCGNPASKKIGSMKGDFMTLKGPFQMSKDLKIKVASSSAAKATQQSTAMKK